MTRIRSLMPSTSGRPEEIIRMRYPSDSGADRVGRSPYGQESAAERDLAALGQVGAADDARQFGAARPKQSCHAENFAAMQREAHPAKPGAARDVPHLQDRLAWPP